MNERPPSGVPGEHHETAERPEGPLTFVNFIRQLAERPESEQEDIFRDLRRRRQVNSYDRGGDSLFIDDAIVELFEQGDIELASRLINPSYSESAPLQRAVIRHYEDDEKASAALSAINEIVAQKIKVFSERLHVHLSEIDPAVAEALTAELRTGVADPESALEVSPAFWANFPTLPDVAQWAVLNTPGSLENAVDAVKELKRSGLLEHAREFIQPTTALLPAERGAYLASAREAIQSFKANYPDLPLGRFEMALLAGHREPHAALELATRTFPDVQAPLAISFLNSALSMLDPRADNPPVSVPEDIAAILPELNEAFRWADMPSSDIPLMISEALKLGPEAIKTVLPHFIKSMSEISGLTEQLNASLGMHHTFNDRGINTIQLSNKELTTILQGKLSPREAMERLDRFAGKRYAANRHYDLIKTFLTDVRDDPEGLRRKPGEPLSAKIERRGLDKYFEGLGIPKGLQDELFRAWISFSPIDYAFSEYSKNEVKALTDSEIDKSAFIATKVFYEQIAAVQDYCEQYGTAELIELNDIFGIVNFTRGTPEQFHNQLLRWKDSKEPVKNINVAATEDHNFAFGNTADGLFFASFGEEGSFYFEVSTIAELSRAFVQVGARERAAGREPLERSEVQNVIISGHGEPRAITLSRNSKLNIENFAVAAYARHQFAEKGGTVRANDYSQYIGNAYRIILHACSAGKEIPESINISQVLHVEYNVPVEAAPRDASGYRLNEGGDVAYKVSGESGDSIYIDSVRHE